MRVVAFVFSLFFTAQVWAYPLVPNSSWTPGQLCTERDRDFAYHRYAERIAYCQRNVSRGIKKQIYDRYQIPKRCQHRYTIDHLIPLSIGGNNSEKNLWPEHVLVKETRPDLEYEVFLALEAGELTQEEAVRIILEEKTRTLFKAMMMQLDDDCDQ